MVAFIDQYRDTWGVEPICAVVPIAPSTYFQRKAQQRDRRRGRRGRSATTTSAPPIQRVWDDHYHGLWAAEGVEAAAARGRAGRALHGRAPDARRWA